MPDPEPIFVDVDKYNVLFTQEEAPRMFLIRGGGNGAASVTLEGEGVEIVARYPDFDTADDAYDQATTAATVMDVISILKEKESK